MERRQLEYFLAVAEHGSFTAAAAHLRVAQPSLSITMQKLERELGGHLFERVPSGVILTSAGEALLSPARQIVRGFDTARESVRDALGIAVGHVDVVAVPAVAAGALSEVIGAFRHSYPQVTVQVITEPNRALIPDQVRSGHFNIGLTVSAVTGPGLITRQLSTQQLHLVLPPESTGLGDSVTVEELAEIELVTLLRGQSNSRAWLEDRLGELGLQPRIAVEADSPAALMPMVLAGAGAALWWLPMANTAPWTTRTVVFRPITPAVQRPVNTVIREGPLPPATRAFLDVLGAWMPNVPDASLTEPD